MGPHNAVICKVSLPLKVEVNKKIKVKKPFLSAPRQRRFNGGGTSSNEEHFWNLINFSPLSKHKGASVGP